MHWFSSILLFRQKHSLSECIDSAQFYYSDRNTLCWMHWFSSILLFRKKHSLLNAQIQLNFTIQTKTLFAECTNSAQFYYSGKKHSLSECINSAQFYYSEKNSLCWMHWFSWILLFRKKNTLCLNASIQLNFTIPEKNTLCLNALIQLNFTIQKKALFVWMHWFSSILLFWQKHSFLVLRQKDFLLNASIQLNWFINTSTILDLAPFWMHQFCSIVLFRPKRDNSNDK